MTNQKRSSKRTIIIIAAVLLALAIGLGFYFLTASQYFSMDINPSIEIETNRLDKVVSLSPLNPDAQTLVAGYRGNGKNLGEVIEDLVDRMILQGYLGAGEPNDILITVKDDSVSQKTLDKVNLSIERQLENRNVKANIHSQKVDWNEETEKSAQLAGVSPGKMSMVEEIAKEAEVSPQELSGLKIGELVNYNKADHEALSDENNVDIDENHDDGWDFLEEDNGVGEADQIDQADVVDSTTTSGEPVDEAGAKAIFDSYYPGVSVQQIKLQDNGTVYYMYSGVGGIRYKMKVRVSDGEVLYNYSSSQGGNYNNNNNNSGSSKEESSVVSTGGAVDEAGAKAIFASYYPGISIEKIELQDGGKVYYMYSGAGGVTHKMKVRVSDGEVLYNYSGSQGGNYNNNNNNSGSSKEESSTTESSVVVASGAVDEAGAKAIFASYYPGISIEKIELQDGGKVYYMYSGAGGSIYKMKVRVSDGEVLYNYSGSQGGGNRGGNNSGGNRGNYNSYR